MRQKFHVNDKGETGKCTAFFKCPYGDLRADHFDSAQEARAAYENAQANKAARSQGNNASAKEKLVAAILYYRESWDRERRAGIMNGIARVNLENFLAVNSVQIDLERDKFSREKMRLEDKMRYASMKLNTSGITEEENIRFYRNVVEIEQELAKNKIESEKFGEIITTRSK